MNYGTSIQIKFLKNADIELDENKIRTLFSFILKQPANNIIDTLKCQSIFKDTLAIYQDNNVPQYITVGKLALFYHNQIIRSGLNSIDKVKQAIYKYVFNDLGVS